MFFFFFSNIRLLTISVFDSNSTNLMAQFKSIQYLAHFSSAQSIHIIDVDNIPALNAIHLRFPHSNMQMYLLV